MLAYRPMKHKFPKSYMDECKKNGAAGGHARNANLSEKRKSAIAKKAAKARWDRVKKTA